MGGKPRAPIFAHIKKSCSDERHHCCSRRSPHR